MNPKHLSKSNLWYTPTWLIEKCREVLGPIDFDPASDKFGNSRVEASDYWEYGALHHEWPKMQSVFLNPPGGKIGLRSQAALFWHKLISEWAAGKFEHGIFIAFSVEIMQTGQCAGVPPQAFPFCVPSTRFGFDMPDGSPSENPSHNCMIVYVPKVEDPIIADCQVCIDARRRECACFATEKFKTAFADVGYVRV